MRKLLLALSIVLNIAALQAQDSLSTTTNNNATDSVDAQKHFYNLYNYTQSSLNNVFNEDWRHGAKNRVDIDFDYFANSNAAPASIAYKLIFKGFISDKLKDRADKKIKSKLKFEDFMKTGITYRHYFPKWDGILEVGYHHRQMRYLTAPKQAFELAFYGNARFEGDTADLSNISFLNLIYNQYSIGIQKNIDYGSYQMQFGISGSFLQCINNQQIKTGESTFLYTAPDADSLILNYDLTFNTAREGATKFGQLNGAGASVDFNLAFMNKDKWKISFDMFDIGYMSFRKTPVNYSAAKNIVFKGIVLPELTNFTAQTFDTLNLDSAVRANLPSKSTNKYYLFLPFTAQLVFSKPLAHNKLVLNVGLQYRYLPGYYVYGFAKLNYLMKKDMVVSVTAGGGAYSSFNLGLEFSKHWKYVDFTLGTANLIGLVAPAYYPGTSVYLRLGSSF